MSSDSGNYRRHGLCNQASASNQKHKGVPKLSSDPLLGETRLSSNNQVTDFNGIVNTWRLTQRRNQNLVMEDL